MKTDMHFVETSTARFHARVVRTIGILDVSIAVHVREWGLATTMISGHHYPYNLLAGVFDGALLSDIEDDYQRHSPHFCVECASNCQTTGDLIALSAAGLTPQPSASVMSYSVRTNTPRIPHSNLVWSTADDTGFVFDYIPEDRERIIRRAYAAQSESIMVSLLHSDGIIASAGIRSEDGYGFLFGAWVAPHRRRRGHYQTLLDARLWYAAEQGCHTIIAHSHQQSAVSRATIDRGFVHGWERQRWRRRNKRQEASR